MSGNYLARNTDATRRFLLEWSAIEREVPPEPYFFSSDNGAIHLQFLRTLFPDNLKLHRSCTEHIKRSIWPNFAVGYGPFVRCTKRALAKYRLDQTDFEIDVPSVKLLLLPRAQAWVRDMQDTDFSWWNGDFMSHSIKTDQPFEPQMLARLASFADFNGNGSMPAECLRPDWMPEFTEQVKLVGRVQMRRELKYLGRWMEQQELKPLYANRDFHKCWPKCPFALNSAFQVEPSRMLNVDKSQNE